jgi:predicted hotdog family 3-hydroxylacyl-ACP dehydratase
MPLDRQWIQSHIPHQGTMCLLDEVLTWNATRVQCRSSTHRDATNPLRAYDRLAAVCGIEYAAQAMAVHGALIASRITASPKSEAIVGYLASVRNVVLYADRLDDVGTDLVATAERVTGDERTVLYDFSVSGNERILLAGRATIVFNTAIRELTASDHGRLNEQSS